MRFSTEGFKTGTGEFATSFISLSFNAENAKVTSTKRACVFHWRERPNVDCITTFFESIHLCTPSVVDSRQPLKVFFCAPF